MADVTCITCTADNPTAFALCERWMSRQTYRGRIQWIVSDGGIEPASCTMGQIHLINESCADPRSNFQRNMLAAIEAVESDFVLWIEHDDWYDPVYVARMVDWLHRSDLAGEGHARYYNVRLRRYWILRNRNRASMSQTGMRRHLLPWFRDLVGRSDTIFVDFLLWRQAVTSSRYVTRASRYSIGMKGVPGKKGLGEGHDFVRHWLDDPDGSVLRSWIGDDAAAYACFADVGSAAIAADDAAGQSWRDS